jgi:tetratricopeptide (TPR) repeat protein
MTQVRAVFLKLNSPILEAFLASDQKAAEAGDGSRLGWALHAFTTADGMADSTLQIWAARSRGKWQPLLAQAERLADLAWSARGVRFASQTRDDQFAAMRALNGQMRSKCQAAIAIKADLCSCHADLVAAAKSGDGDLTAIARTAFAACPIDYHLEAGYLQALTPRWGGSYEEIEKALAAARGRGMSAYDMSRLRNLVRVAKYQDLRDAGRMDDAFAILSEGIASEPTPSVWKTRALMEKVRGNAAAAISDANEAIRASKGGWLITPYDLADLLYTRAWALDTMGRREEARQDIALALKADAKHSGVWRLATAWGIR